VVPETRTVAPGTGEPRTIIQDALDLDRQPAAWPPAEGANRADASRAAPAPGVRPPKPSGPIDSISRRQDFCCQCLSLDIRRYNWPGAIPGILRAG
jgi:hypothetical protein